MRKIIFMLLLSATALGVRAQRIEGVKSRLATAEIGAEMLPARVKVREAGSAADAVRRGEAASNTRSANGFRVVIFFDNGSSARSEAERIQSRFAEEFPDVKCDIRYENPYFKLLAGNCITSEEAVVLLGRVRSSYPEAYIMRDEIPIQNFISPKLPDEEPQPEESDPTAIYEY